MNEYLCVLGQRNWLHALFWSVFRNLLVKIHILCNSRWEWLISHIKLRHLKNIYIQKQNLIYFTLLYSSNFKSVLNSCTLSGSNHLKIILTFLLDWYGIFQDSYSTEHLTPLIHRTGILKIEINTEI